ncbi:MAG: transglutaminase domain-containing protein [Nitrospirota bacterium]|nr:transglutaminase domain-containing protein [Nitrospirota bacterium]
MIYDIVNPRGVAFIPDYSNESFSQKVISQDEFSKRVQVTSRMTPLKTRVPFPIPSGLIPANYRQYLASEKDRQSNDGALMRKAQEITAGSRYAHEAANSILSWIADSLTFDSSITVPADAVSAFKFRKAYCVGYSNLAVAMLRAAGIPARVAHGYLPPGYEWGFSKEYWGVKVNDGGFHAYLEIYYPDTGWVFSDAEHSQHFVDPFHIILRLDGIEMPGVYKGGFLDVDKATFFTIFKEEDRTVMVDELPFPKEKRLGRRLDDRQHTALISGQVHASSGGTVAKGTAVLWKDGRGTQHPFSDGRYVVAVANAGKYRLELKGSGFAKSSYAVDIEQGKVYRKDFILAPGGVIRGKVTGSNGKPLDEGDVFYRDGTTSFGIPIDQDGTYRIEGLSPGQYKLSVTVGGRTVNQQVSVIAGKETVQDFTIP